MSASHAEIAAKLDGARHWHRSDDGRASGAPLMNFQRGWALTTFSRGDFAHWFVRDGSVLAASLCNFANRTPVTQLLGPGNYPRCSLCTRKMTALIRRGEM